MNLSALWKSHFKNHCNPIKTPITIKFREIIPDLFFSFSIGLLIISIAVDAYLKTKQHLQKIQIICLILIIISSLLLHILKVAQQMSMNTNFDRIAKAENQAINLVQELIVSIGSQYNTWKLIIKT